MTSVPTSQATIPLPEPALSFAGVPPAADGAGMRRFGIYKSDLAIDFTRTRTPVLIRTVLEQCTVDPDGALPPRLFSDLPVGHRLECLLALAAGEARTPFSFPFHCSGCMRELEMELTVDEVAEL